MSIDQLMASARIFEPLHKLDEPVQHQDIQRPDN